MNKPYAARSHEEMKEVLMDSVAPGPAVHYHMIRGGRDKGNVTVWEPGQVGGEYIKSYGHYHVDALPETYKILSGEGYLLMQKRKASEDGKPIDDEIEEFRAVKVGPGQDVFIPAGWGHLMTNTGETWLITYDDSPVQDSGVEKAGWPAHADYEPYKKLRGAAYYLVEKDDRPEFIKNPLYKRVPEPILDSA